MQRAAGIVAFRTHIWDEQIAGMAARLRARCGNWDFAVLADETRGALDVGAYRKIAHTEDFSGLGLPRSGHPRELWFNADYGLYPLLRIEPRYDLFCISEYDVFANADLSPLLTTVAAEGLDVVTHRLGEAPASWTWRKNALAAYPVVHWSFNPFLVVSRRALEYLLERRQAQARAFRDRRLRAWPYFEAFVGGELAGSGGRLEIAELARFGRLDRFDWTPPFRLSEAPLWSEGQLLVHPVHSDARYVASLFSTARQPQDYFDPGSKLRQRLQGLPWRVIAPHLRAALWRKRAYLAWLRTALNPADAEGPS